jgi:hypothetical protein
MELKKVWYIDSSSTYFSAYTEFSFNLFCYVYVIMYIVVAPIAVIHGGKYFGLIAIVWGVDLFVRYLLQGRKVDQARLSLVGDGMVRVQSFPCFSLYHSSASSWNVLLHHGAQDQLL